MRTSCPVAPRALRPSRECTPRRPVSVNVACRAPRRRYQATGRTRFSIEWGRRILFRYGLSMERCLAIISFTSHLREVGPTAACSYPGGTLAEVLEAVAADYPR